MEIRNILRGTATGFAAAGPARKSEKSEASTDRMELTRRWVEQMEDQRKQLLDLLSRPADREKKNDGGIFGYMEAEEDRLDNLSEQLKVQQKCQEIARRIMQGKKVPLKDELYLMEHDPEGYKLAMALRKPPKKDEEECESVLDDEDEQSGEASGAEEAVPAETGGETPTASDSGEISE